MRTILTFSFILFVFNSCTRYQYLTLASENTSRNEENQFIVDNGDFRITYDFYGLYGPLHLRITNKRAALLEVDWSRSFLIRAGAPEPLFKPGGAISGELEREASSRSTLINATLIQSSSTQLIPGGSAIVRECPVIWPKKKLLSIKRDQMKKEKVNVLGLKKKIWKADILKDISLSGFRVYLTLKPGKDAEPVVVDQTFYVTAVTETKVNPKDLTAYQQGNVMVLRGPTKLSRGGVLFSGCY